jgi:ribonuclease-3
VTGRAVSRRRSVKGGAGAAGGADLAALEAALGYRFGNRALLAAALAHSSLAGRGVARAEGFDRLEFLGDRVIGLVVAEMILERYPADSEGAIARRHAALVNRDTLARVAREMGLGPHMQLSLSEVQAGGRDNPGVLADAFEALIAALYRDGGLDAARQFLTARFAPLVLEVAVPPRDAKTALQEWAQGHGLSLPAYRTLSMSGPSHKPRITVEVRIDGLAPETAESTSRRAAEQEAAAALLERAKAAKRAKE